MPLAGRRAASARASGLTYIDHLTHNVYRGRMDEWADFYERLFNFREIRYFDIEGKLTGLKSQGDDQPVRQDPHPDQRERRTTSRRSRNTSTRITARASSTSRSAPTTSTRPSRRCATQGVRSRTRPTPTTSWSTTRLPGHGEDVDALAAEPHPDRRRADQGRRAAAADLHRDRDRPDLLRDHPAQGQRGLRRGQLPGAVRDRSSSTRSAAAC